MTVARGVAPIWGIGPVDVLRFGEVEGRAAST
jgi:hypothetical protein